MAEPEVIDEAAAMAEFHAGYKRRNFRVMLIAGLFSLLIGVVIAIVGIVAGQTIDSHVEYVRDREYANMIKVLVGGVAFIVVGLGLLGGAYKIKNSE